MLSRIEHEKCYNLGAMFSCDTYGMLKTSSVLFCSIVFCRETHVACDV